jgi:hypothetical protein
MTSEEFVPIAGRCAPHFTRNRHARFCDIKTDRVDVRSAWKNYNMKVIISRRGFDSATDACPSPIIDQRPFSVPIDSSRATPMRYGDLPNKLGNILCELTGNVRWLEDIAISTPI